MKTKCLLLLLVVFVAVMRSWYGTHLDSFGNDEPFHVVAGVSYVKTGDFRLNPEHPPLTKLWVGLFNQWHFKLRPFEPLNDKHNERNYVEETMYYDNDYNKTQFISRVAMWSFNGILMLIFMALMWLVFNYTSAILAGLILALEPSVSAHLPLVMTDLPVALSLISTGLAAVMLNRHWNLKWMLILGVITGITLTIKFSAISGLLLLYALLGIAALHSGVKNNWNLAGKKSAQILSAGILSLVLLWASYGFQYHASPNGSDPFNRTIEQKIDDLNTPKLQKILHMLNDTRIVPKAYVWGLADTVRAGIEGRGRAWSFIYGTNYEGVTPWFFWPAILASKVPLPILILAVFALLASVWIIIKPPKQKSQHLTALWFLLPLLAAYSLTLMNSEGTYAGIRHALPLVTILVSLIAVLPLFFSARLRPRVTGTITMFLMATLLITMPEKRLWEYHNETVGGTENAYKYFYNEGLYLGQRTKEIIQYIIENDLQNEDFYRFAWFMEEELLAANINIPTIAKDINDDNSQGYYEGYHLVKTSGLIKWEHWDPADIDHWERLVRFGNIYVMKGPYEDPRDWASSMKGIVTRYLLEEDNPDWQKVVQRMQQVTAIRDYDYDVFVTLGNAHVKTQNREQAITAYQKALDLLHESKTYRNKITAQLAALQSKQAIETIDILRSDTAE